MHVGLPMTIYNLWMPNSCLLRDYIVQDEAAARQANDQEQASRRRMQDRIQFVGYLFKHQMLTEKWVSLVYWW